MYRHSTKWFLTWFQQSSTVRSKPVQALNFSPVKISSLILRPLATTTTTSHDEPPKLEKELRSAFVVPTALELKSKVDCNDIYLIDVRENHEVATGRVNAKRYVNVPVGEIFFAMSLSPADFMAKHKVPKPDFEDDDIVLMCLGGIRSTWALQILHTFGYNKSRHFPGGWSEWNKHFPESSV